MVMMEIFHNQPLMGAHKNLIYLRQEYNSGIRKFKYAFVDIEI